MNTMRLKPATKYLLYSGAKAWGAFFAIITLMMGFFVAVNIYAISRGGQVEASFAGLGLGGAVMMFVLGLVTVRENLKLFLQNGCGRLTVFAADVLGSLAFAVTGAFASELLLLIFTLLNPAKYNINISSIFLNGIGYQVGGLPFFTSMLLRICGMLLAWRFGMFASLVYYRLNRLGKVAVSIIVPALLFIGLPVSADRGLIPSESFSRCFNWLIASPYNSMTAMLLIAIPFTLCGWLLLRRAQVKE